MPHRATANPTHCAKPLKRMKRPCSHGSKVCAKYGLSGAWFSKLKYIPRHSKARAALARQEDKDKQQRQRSPGKQATWAGTSNHAQACSGPQLSAADKAETRMADHGGHPPAPPCAATPDELHKSPSSRESQTPKATHNNSVPGASGNNSVSRTGSHASNSNPVT